MATRINMFHPRTGLNKPGFIGFSWTTLLFGGFPALFRGDLAVFAGYILLQVLCSAAMTEPDLILWATVGSLVAQIAWAVNYNRYYTTRMLSKGWVFRDAEHLMQQAQSKLNITPIVSRPVSA